MLNDTKDYIYVHSIKSHISGSNSLDNTKYTHRSLILWGGLIRGPQPDFFHFSAQMLHLFSQ